MHLVHCLVNDKREQLYFFAQLFLFFFLRNFSCVYTEKIWHPSPGHFSAAMYATSGLRPMSRLLRLGRPDAGRLCGGDAFPEDPPEDALHGQRGAPGGVQSQVGRPRALAGLPSFIMNGLGQYYIIMKARADEMLGGCKIGFVTTISTALASFLITTDRLGPH
jgi:hypothetical protein